MYPNTTVSGRSREYKTVKGERVHDKKLGRVLSPQEMEAHQYGWFHVLNLESGIFLPVRGNGKMKEWKTKPNKEFPCKYGLKECARLYWNGGYWTGHLIPVEILPEEN